jgi:hypothetical protein
LKKPQNRLGEIEDPIRNLKAELPSPRPDLTEIQKDQLLQAIGGPATALNILNALKTLPPARIYWLFNSIDPQLIADILHHDLSAAIERARTGRTRGSKK